MKNNHSNNGFTLIELMITVAIVGILSAIVIPAFVSYTEDADKGAVEFNAQSLAVAEENFFYENDTYLAGTYVAGVGSVLSDALGWKPKGDHDLYKYAVTAGPCGNITKCYTVTVKLISDPTRVSHTISGP